jgi:dTDP-4-dehydrorhamnose reductase
MKILILGADGMIGHKIAHSLYQDFDLILTSRKKISIESIGVNSGKLIYHDFLDNMTYELLDKIMPDVIINCIGITTRRGIKDSFNNTTLLNSKLPHSLDYWVKSNAKKLIHFSTDCVFSGTKGNYLDNDIPDAKDLYGETKSAGEINSSNTLNIRCSMIGRELFNFTELFEWLILNKNKKIEGFSNVIYSGITTVRMGKIIHYILKHKLNLSGIYNISSLPISKYDLLIKLSEAFSLNVDIEKNTYNKSNKVLISKKFTEITGMYPPNWDDLISEFKDDCKKFKSLYKN